MAFMLADVTDLEARWRPLSEAEKVRAEVLLTDASAVVVGESPDLARGDLNDGRDALALMVVCSMVKRSMSAGDAPAGVATASESNGPFSESFTFSNPDGNLYLTKAERRMLGIGGQRAFSIDMAPAPVAHPWGLL